MHITFIQTGGTIDKDYKRGEDNHGYAFTIDEAAVRRIIPQSHALFEYDVVAATKKDSLDLTDEDRQKILDAVQNAASGRVIITHGTDTLLKTASVLNGRVEGKTVVLTGAMLPEKFKNSDALFNVGMAVGAAQILSPGIYIALYGHVVSWMQFRELHDEYELKSKIIATATK